MAAPKQAIGSGRQITPVQTISAESEGFTSLVSRLGDDVMQLVDTKLSLLKVELREEANTLLRSVIVAAAAGAVTLVGFVLLNVAVGFAVSVLFAGTSLSQPAQFALGFTITGLFYLLVGGAVVAIVKSRLARFDPVPNRTVEELRKDKQWLKNEI